MVCLQFLLYPERNHTMLLSVAYHLDRMTKNQPQGHHQIPALLIDIQPLEPYNP